jgi:hypothetical protein
LIGARFVTAKELRQGFVPSEDADQNVPVASRNLPAGPDSDPGRFAAKPRRAVEAGTGSP